MEHPLIGNEQQRAKPTIARLLTVGGAHVVVSGIAADYTLRMECEGCGQSGGPYLAAAHETDADVARAALRAAQRHAEQCRHIPKQLWPENAGGAQ